MARANCSRRPPSASTRTPPTCSSISMNSADAGERSATSRRRPLAESRHRLHELPGDLIPEHMPAAGDDFQPAAPHAIDQRVARREDPRVEDLIAGLAGEGGMAGAKGQNVGPRAGRELARVPPQGPGAAGPDGLEHRPPA